MGAESASDQRSARRVDVGDPPSGVAERWGSRPVVIAFGSMSSPKPTAAATVYEAVSSGVESNARPTVPER